MDFSQLAILFVVASVFGILSKVLRQPLLVGYLFAGFTLASIGLLRDGMAIEPLGQIGVALLLFLLGLEMKVSELPSIGRVALVTGLGQIFFTSGIGFLISRVIGIPPLASLYIAVALTFSSTIIMVKLLSEKKDLSSLYGRISVGFLLVQDFVAIIILMFLSGYKSGGFEISDLGLIIAKGALILLALLILSHKALPYLFDKIMSSSTELTFIASIAWALGVAAIIGGPLGFTLEVGGFLAGLSLSGLPEHLQIASRTRPLRDFFLTLFFLLLGTKLVLGGGVLLLLPKAILFSLFVLIGNPLIVLIILGLLGFKKRTSFMAGLTVAQISEFSFILMAMGESLGHVGNEEVSLVVMVGAVTMTFSTYLILEADKVYEKIKKALIIFERKRTDELSQATDKVFKNHIVLIGADRTGMELVNYFIRKKHEFLAVDFNPRVIEKLKKIDALCVFGDITDSEIYYYSNPDEAKIVISTTSNLKDNLVILARLKKSDSKAVSLFTAVSRRDAVILYENGADYVVVTDVVAGDYLKHLIAAYGSKTSKLEKTGQIHYKKLLIS